MKHQLMLRSRHLTTWLFNSGLEFIYRYKRELSILGVGLGVLLDILFVKQGNVTIIVLLLLWSFLIKTYRLREITFFLLAILGLLFTLSTYYLKMNQISDRAAAWVWLNLAITLLLLLKKMINNQPRHLDRL